MQAPTVPRVKRRVALPRAASEALRSSELWAVAALVAAAALARFATLDVQSFDFDEIATAWLVKMNLGDMVSTIPRSESTPPLYYLIAWFWTRAFGTGEVGLRSLSAVAGTATVPVVYVAAKELVSRRAALIAAALVTTSPWLVWFSQQARAYALLVLFGGLSFLFFSRCLRAPSGRTIAWWAVVSSLALLTHYFAAFLVGPEALWLVLGARRRRATVVAACVPVAVGLALLPLALHQRGQGHGDMMVAQSGSLGLRLAQLPKDSLVGYDAPAEKLAALAAAMVCAFALALLVTRADSRERHGARRAGAVGAAALALPLGLAVVGLDYVVARNIIAAWLPLAVVVGAGLAARRARRAGAAGAIAVCTLFVVVVVAVALDPSYQREEWRGAAAVLGPAAVDRAIVLNPRAPPVPYRVYVPRLAYLPRDGARVAEIDLVDIANVGGSPGHGRRVARPAAPRPPMPGFREVLRRYEATYTVIRFHSDGSVPVTPAALAAHALEKGRRPAVLFQRATKAATATR